VSKICLGTATFGVAPDAQEAVCVATTGRIRHHSENGCSLPREERMST